MMLRCISAQHSLPSASVNTSLSFASGLRTQLSQSANACCLDQLRQISSTTTANLQSRSAMHEEFWPKKRKPKIVEIRSHNKDPNRLKVPVLVRNEKGEIVPKKKKKGPTSSYLRRKHLHEMEVAKEAKIPEGHKLESYRLAAASIVERPPVVIPPPEEWEKEHVLRYRGIDEERQAAWKVAREKRWQEYVAREKETGKKQRAVSGLHASQKKKGDDDEDDGEIEEPQRREGGTVALKGVVKIETYTVPSLTWEDTLTTNDHTNNRKSLYRALTTYLYLLVKKDRKDHAWQFPQGSHERTDGWHLRHTAERELAEECGKDLECWWLGNAPCAWWAYPHNDQAAKKLNAPGSRVFFYRSWYSSGDVQVDGKEIVDHVWVTKQEMQEYLDPTFYNYIKDTLME